MADNTIALQAQAPNPMSTIGNMLNFANSIQQYKQGGVNLARSQATFDAEVAQKKAESQLAQTNASTAVATQPSVISTAQSQASTAATGAQSAQWKLTSDQAAKGYEIAGGLLQDPSVVKGDSAGSVQALMGAEDQMRAHGIPEPQIRVQMAPLYATAAHNPQQLRQLLANVVQSGMSPQGQAGQSLIPASGQQQPSGAVDTSGNPTALNRDQFGNLSQAPLPVSAGAGQPPGAAPAGSPMRIPPGETPDTLKQFTDLRASSNAAASAAPTQHFNNQQILRLSPDAFTGTGTGALTKVLNSFGLQSTNNIGADTSQLQHFLALQIEQNAQAQGANTDAARQLAAQAVLPGSSPLKAIQAITKVNDAYVTGSELFNQGLENAVKTSPNGVFATRDFRNKWSQAMDPRIFQIENAVNSGDKAEVTRITSQLGPQGVAQLRQKALALKALIGGQNAGP